MGQNLFPYSDPSSASQIAISSGTTVAPFSWPGGPGLKNAVSFGDNSTNRLYYQSFTGTVGTTYTMSAYIVMDDGNAPTSADLTFTMNATTDLAPTFTKVSDTVYRATLTRVCTLTNTAYGVLKRTSYSARSFKATGLQLVIGSRAGALNNRSSAALLNPTYIPTGVTKSNQLGQNLLTNSDPASLTQVAVKDQVTVASYAWPTGPGLGNAVSFGDNSIARYAYQQFSVTAGTQYTLSFYARMEDNTVPIVAGSTAPSDFVPVWQAGVLAGAATPMGNGVYRITATAVATITGVTNFGVVKYTSNSTKSFKISGYQLVKGAKPGAYNRTLASAFNSSFVPTGVNKSRQVGQNLLLRSEEQENVVVWNTHSGDTVTANAVAAPDGNKTADQIDFAVTTSYHYQSNISSAGLTGKNATFSIWLYSTSKATIGMRANGLPSNPATALSVNLTPGWKRYSFTFPVALTDTLVQAGLDNRVGVGGDGIAGTVYVWGAQIVPGIAPGAYNKTTASALNASYVP